MGKDLPTNYFPEFSKLLSGYLTKQERSQSWLAERLGVHHGTISRWIIQGTRPQSPETIRRIADILGIHSYEELQVLLATAGFGISLSNEIDATSEAVGTRWQTSIDSSLGSIQHVRLFGIEDYAERLTHLLLELDDLYVIGIYGIGGLGKTALADHVIRQPAMGQRFEGLAWVTIKQHEFIPDHGIVNKDNSVVDIEGIIESLCVQLQVEHYQKLPPQQRRTALLQRVNSVPCLIVLDNLEDIPDKHKLMPFLHSLTKPSKVLVTSRHTLPSDPEITHVHLAHLSKDNTINFLYHLIQMNGSPHPSSVSDDRLDQIYDYTGGHPLALRLVASQVNVLSLPDVLQNLSRMPDDETDQFYGFIYQNSWEMLEPNSQKLLALMPLVESASSEQLAAITELSRAELNTALRELVRMSLVEVSGDLDERRYFVFRLTETFLLKDSFAWQPDGSRNSQFSVGVERNLAYWQEWLTQYKNNVDKLEDEQSGILKAIRHGLSDSRTLQPTYELIENFAEHMERRGYWETWNHILHLAIEAAQKSASLSKLPLLSFLHARLLSHQSRLPEAVSQYVRTTRFAKQQNDIYTKARAWSNLGYLYTELERWWRAETLCVHALQIFEEEQSAHGLAHTHNHLGILYTRQCKWDAAWQHLEQALALWQQMENQHGVAVANLNIGKLANDMSMEETDAPHHASIYLKQAIEYGEQTADEVMVSVARMNMGISYLIKRESEKAKLMFCTAEEIFERYKDTLNLALIADNLGVVYGIQEEKELAIEHFEKALALWRGLESVYGEIRALLYLAEWTSKFGDKSAGKLWLIKAEELLSEHNVQQKYESLARRSHKIRSSL